ITETAKALWFIYLVLTVACAGAYLAAGMDALDAVAHSFSTVATAGFSTHDASMGHFQSPVIEWIAVLFMFLGGVNFSLHFLVWRSRRPLMYLRDPEFRAYLLLLLALTLVVTLTLAAAGGVER